MPDIKVNIKKDETIKRVALKKNKKIANNKRETLKNNSIFRNLLPIIIISALVGGGIYVWQNSQKEKDVREAKNVTRRVKEDFEKKMAILENKIEKTQKENLELKKNKEALEDKVGLLAQAKKEFNNDDLGLYFLYPITWGEIVYSKKNGIWNLAFPENANLVIGGIESNYQASTTKNFTELSFEEKRNKYYLKFYVNGEEKKEEITPKQVLNVEGGKAVVLGSSSLKDGSKLPIKPSEEMLVIIVGLDKDNYQAAVFVDKNTKDMPENDLFNVINSIKISR